MTPSTPKTPTPFKYFYPTHFQGSWQGYHASWIYFANSSQTKCGL